VGQESDEGLLQAIAAQKPEALGTLYERYGGVALGLSARMLGDRAMAEDVVQEAFLLVWRRATTYQGDRGSVRTWLLSIVHHRSIDLLRSRGAARTEPLDLTRHDQARGDVWTDAYAQLSQEQIKRALGQLPMEQREAIELSFFAGLTQQQIAAKLEAPLGTVKGRIRLGLRKLKGLLDDLQPGD
jgi:RNA polymerase sigma-70 factor (ECF subfamily)